MFFTSRNSFKYFFSQHKIEDTQKVGCVGSGTYKVLSKFVNEISYVGNSVDTDLVGSEFTKIVGEGTCLFPISNISKRTIQKYFKDQSKVKEVVVYNTYPIEKTEIPFADVLVFTSPSNVKAYCDISKIDSKQIIVAMGPSTGAQLNDLGHSNYFIPKIPGELGIIDVLNSISLG